MMALAGAQPRWVGRVVFSALTVLVAGWMIYKGIELIRFDHLNRRVASTLAADVGKSSPPAELTTLQDDIGAWRDSSGVRALARTQYQALGRASYQQPSASMANAVSILQIDPVIPNPWLDIAEAAWATPETHALAFEAWAMSSIVAPRELEALQRRISFLAAVWPDASEAQKRRMFFEVDSLLDKQNAMRTQWRFILASLSPDRRREVEEAFRVYNPAYRR